MAAPGAPRVRMPDATTLVALGTFLLALVVYRATMLPGVGSWDTAENQTVPALLGTMHPTGFPAYVILGWVADHLLAPFGSTAFRMNLLSGILAAGAGALSVFVYRRLGAPALLAGAIAVAFALAPITWHIGVSADVHSLHIFLVVLVTLLLLRWDAAVEDAREAPDDEDLARRADRRIVLAAAVFGIAAANHALSLLMVPGIGLFVLVTDRGILRRPKVVLAALGVSIGVAALLYLELPLRAGPFRAPLVYGHPETLSRPARDRHRPPVPGRRGRRRRGRRSSGRSSTSRGAQLGPLLYLVPAAFVVTAIRRPRYALLLGGDRADHRACSRRLYANADIDRYYLGPLFLAWSWVAVTGGEIVARLLADRRRRPGDLRRRDRPVARRAVGRPRAGAARADGGRAPERGTRTSRPVDGHSGRGLARRGVRRPSTRTRSCSRGGPTRPPCGTAS